GKIGEVTGQGYEFGEHTFRLQRIIGSDTTFFVDNCEGAGCHDGTTAPEVTSFYTFDKIDSIRYKTDSLETLLKSANILDNSDPDGLKLRTDTTIKAEEARILYNYLLLRHDGTEGVHNPLFVSNLLDSTLIRWDSIPRADFYLEQLDFCLPVTIDITDTSTGSITDYLWNFGDGTTSTDYGSTSHEYTEPGYYQILLVISGTGGEDSAYSGQIAIYDVPVANFTSTGTLYIDTIIVEPDTTYVTDSVLVSFSDATAGGATVWSWTFGDGGTSLVSDPTYLYENPDSTYNVTLTATNPCGTDDTTVTIYTYLPTADFVMSDDTVGVEVSVVFTDQSIGALTWEWDFGDSETSNEQNPTHSYSETGSYPVNLTVTNTFGSDVFTDTVFVIGSRK
ncbi:MAG: PKD domain-containing protein, partial [Candidatus Zixiibacteriota bacterium]